MIPSDKIYVAGHRGLVGSALVRRLRAAGYTNIIIRSRAELDLTHQAAVNQFFQQDRPDHVLMAAAKVGGIHANSIYPAEFIFQNLVIETNVIHAAYQHRVKKLLFLGSSCIYPRLAPQPMKEKYLLTGLLEPTNEPYAIAKIAGIKLCSAYHRQYGANFFSVMPTNLYGPGDNYDLENSHVLPALLRKMHEAKKRRDKEVVVWGSGTPRREFLYCEDMADACVYLMERYGASEIGEFVNLGVGKDIAIRELASVVAEIVGFPGQLIFDATRPDGAPQKLLDVSRLHALGWHAKIGLEEGLEKTYQAYRTSLPSGK
jgi:GDP-L-fucose synthase